MPHQCTGCDEVYEDGTDEVLTGCSECGGTTFQFVPSGGDSGDEPSEDKEHWMGGGFINGSPNADDDQREDASQHAARTDVVDELPFDAHGASEDAESEPAAPAATDAIDALREELNRQFEGIRVLEPGQYEINLTRLFEREECIIALQGDGRYEISIPGHDGERDLDLQEE